MAIEFRDWENTESRTVELAKQLEENSVNLWITDPPFAVDTITGVASFAQYNETKSNVSTPDVMDSVYQELIPTMFNKLIEGSHFYMFLGFYWYPYLTKLLRDTGFLVDDQPLIWHKKGLSMLPKDYHYASAYEAVLFGRKPGSRRLAKPQIGNVFAISRHSKKVHPLQRPEELLNIFIENSSMIGETVVDTFAGSASTLVAARKLQRNAIGFELDEGNYLRALDWISKEITE